MENIIMVLTREYGTVGCWLIIAGIVSAIVNYVLILWTSPKDRVEVGINVPVKYLLFFVLNYIIMSLLLMEGIIDMSLSVGVTLPEVLKIIFFQSLWFYLIEVAVSGPILWAIYIYEDYIS